jgi:hypothetical protein
MLFKHEYRHYKVLKPCLNHDVMTFDAVNLVTLIAEREIRKLNVLLFMHYSGRVANCAMFSHSSHVHIQLENLGTAVVQHHVIILRNASFPLSSCDRLAATRSLCSQ